MPVVVSMFSGAGGLDEGFRAVGFDIACCVDIEEWACDTLRTNHPNLSVMGPPKHTGNIKEISAQEICRFANLKKKEVDVLIGGPPCQPFSQAATQRFLKDDKRFKRLGFEDLTKGTLLHEFVRLILEFKPRVFLLENVPGLLKIDGGMQLGQCLNELRENGYYISNLEALNAADYGVPQYRERLIIWGSKKNQHPALPVPTHASFSTLFQKEHLSVAHALTGLPQNLQNHTPRKHNKSSIERYRTLQFGEREKLGRVDRLDPRKPSKTVIAGGMHGGGRSHLHPFIGRTLTVRECARIQTFPDDYIFQGSIARQFTQVGNAVPPLLAEHIARQIMKQEFEINVDEEFRHGQYLHRSTLLNALIEQLLVESIEEKPEWIYYTHSTTRSRKIH